MHDLSSEWDVYYDECKADGYWHCFLFVPKLKITQLYDLIMRARAATGYYASMHYIDIGKKAKLSSPRVKLLIVLLEILKYIIQQQKVNAAINFTNKERKRFMERIGARVVIFRDCNIEYSSQMQGNYQKRVEATFRMGLKGALHYLFSNENPTIDRIYVDFDDACFHQAFNVSNMWERLKVELRTNINFTAGSAIYPFGKKQYAPNCETSQIMQFVDNVLGSFRNIVIQAHDFPARYNASEILKPLLQRNIECLARNKQSRFFKGFALTDAYVENDKWVFQPMQIVEDRSQQEISFVWTGN